MNVVLDRLLRLSRNGGYAKALLSKEIEDSDQDIFKYTSRISIELSNLCNYAGIHKRCPLSLIGEPMILPAKIVIDVLDTLEHHDFRGTIAYHTYNEPLIDPRLFKFIEYAREARPQNEIYICTNGYYLNQTLLDELVAAGVSNMHVSAYSRTELERLAKLRTSIPYKVELMQLDDRLHLYEAEEKSSDIARPCFAPLSEIIIGREGCVSLCCLDWQRLYVFGDLGKRTFEEILRSGELQAVYERLSRGDRFLPLCKRCGWSR